MKLRAGLIAPVWLCGVAAMGGDATAGPSETRATLNGLEIALDGGTGAIRRLSHPGPGALLDAESGEAGLVDVAYPIPEFEPLRLAARHGARASVRLADREVAIVLNQGAEGSLTSPYDLAPWVPGHSAFAVTECAANGRTGAPRDVAAAGQIRTGSLRPLELALFEFVKL